MSDSATAVARRNTEEVQCRGNWDLYNGFVDHTPQPGATVYKNGVLELYQPHSFSK